MINNEIRKVEVTIKPRFRVSGEDVTIIKGNFHKWFDKNHGDVSFLYVVVEGDGGTITLYDIEKYDIQFID